MSFEEDASSWALSLFDSLESHTQTRKRIVVAAGAALVTIVMWTVHLLNPDVFAFFLNVDSWSKIILGVLFAPPFVLAFVVGSFIYPQPVEPQMQDRTGLMSTYFYKERSSKRWKLLIVAAFIAALNFLLMLVTSGI
jgi:hypothetical protein